MVDCFCLSKEFETKYTMTLFVWRNCRGKLDAC
uniref:Uncharacterized protein n=1 Tax=Arundo donax TaxID=35708 RepID=A0A0A8ZRQ5_ARUDO